MTHFLLACYRNKKCCSLRVNFCVPPYVGFGEKIVMHALRSFTCCFLADRVVGLVPLQHVGSRFFCAGTHGIGYSWPGMRVKCIQYTVGSVLLGIRARSDVDVKQSTFYLYLYLYVCCIPQCHV